MIARNYSANGKIPVKGTLKRFNQLKRFNYNYLPIALPRSLGTHWGQTYMSGFTHLGQTSICDFVVLGLFLARIGYK